MKYISLITLLLSLSGCFHYNINGYQKATDNFDYWYKKDVNSTETIKAMLECGFDSPRGYGSGIARRCMVKSGFENENFSYCKPLKVHKKNSLRRQSTYQSSKTDVYFSACELPIKDIPDRNITKRLNSGWCKSSWNYEYCLP